MVSYKNLASKYLKLVDAVVPIVTDYYSSVSLPLEGLNLNKIYNLIIIDEEATIHTDWYTGRPYVTSLREYNSVVMMSTFTSHSIDHGDIYSEGYSFTIKDTPAKIDLFTEDYNITWFIV